MVGVPVFWALGWLKAFWKFNALSLQWLTKSINEVKVNKSSFKIISQEEVAKLPKARFFILGEPVEDGSQAKTTERFVIWQWTKSLLKSATDTTSACKSNPFSEQLWSLKKFTLGLPRLYRPPVVVGLSL
jgi:hypothetical protein